MAKAKKKSPRRRQVAALPYRVNDSGELEVLLLTSRQTRRFIIPKGWLKRRLGESKTAAEEAFEEAGVEGIVEKKPIGAYSYWKRQARSFEHIRVNVFPIKITEQKSRWPEKDQRSAAWLPVKDAAVLIDEQDLAAFLLRLDVSASGELIIHAPGNGTSHR